MAPDNKLIALFLLLAGLTFAESGNTQNMPISIGIIAPLTGDFASAGENIQRGITLAQEDLRTEKVNVAVHFEDACLPAAGVSSFKKLVQLDKVDAIVSNYCVVTLAAIAEMIEKEKIPTLQNSVFPETLFKDRKYLFSTWPSIGAEVAQSISFLKAKGALSKIGVLYLETPWGLGYAESLKNLVPQSGGEIAGWENNLIGANDFRLELTRVRAANPSALFMAHTGTMLSGMLKQARGLGLQVPIFVPSDADDQQIVTAAGQAAEGVSLYATDSPTPTEKMKKFATTFKTRFKVEPNPLARHAYDQLYITAGALQKCKRDRECAAASLRSPESIDGVSGTFKLGIGGGAERNFFYREVRNGRFEFAERK